MRPLSKPRLTVATLVSVLLFLTAAVVLSPPAEAQTPTPPARPAAGQLGGLGPCGNAPTQAELDTNELTNFDWTDGTSGPIVQSHVLFPGSQQWKVWVFEPNGTASPRSGGTCNDNRRPVVLIVHGFPAQQIVGLGEARPRMYGSLIQHLVSNGYVAVFVNYDFASAFTDPGPFDPLNINQAWARVWIGFDQAVRGFSDPIPNPWGLQPRTPMTTRANLNKVGLFGHSLGGGMLPLLSTLTFLQSWDHDGDGDPGDRRQWGNQALFVNFNAAHDMMWHCRADDDDGDGQRFEPAGGGEFDPDPFPSSTQLEPDGITLRPGYCDPARHRVGMPGHTDVLFTSYEFEDCFCTVHTGSKYLFDDLPPENVDRKWAVLVRSDCTHPNADCDWSADAALPSSTLTGHLTPTDPGPAVPSPFARGRNYLKWYGVNRNFQLLAECADETIDHPPAGDDCGTTYVRTQLARMGNWSNGPAATPSNVIAP
jgi:hypothetical protein